MDFKLTSPFKPTGDQPKAIEKLVTGLQSKFREQTLLGVTGSGKTFTMANVIQQVQRPTLIISHNKTLAAQLATEFQDFFPNNAVHYFVSYYDYYQPEAYIAKTDTYIEKETSINEEIDRLRHASTQALLSRRDVIIVASVSCIYGLGSPDKYKQGALTLHKGQTIKRQKLLTDLVNAHFERNQIDLWRGRFRVLGDTIEIFPAVAEHDILRIKMFGDEIEAIEEVELLGNRLKHTFDTVDIFPATHYLPEEGGMDETLLRIETDLANRLKELKRNERILEAERLKQRVNFDLDMIRETGYCSGIENYSRYFDGRKPGTPPYTLVDFFPKDFLLFIDESHMTVPQIGGMYEGDRSRKSVLVDYGFRLPAAFDNRPLKYQEFEKKISQVVYVSATPKAYELERSKQVVEQVIRPTGLLDPTIEIRPTKFQIDNLLEEIRDRTSRHERVLVTTLTTRMAEDLTEHLKELSIKVAYIHHEVATMERLEILRDLRTGTFDVLVGVNLLREGLDLPEVSLVAILDADKEGFLRSDTSLIQVMGRAARHASGHVIMYADHETDSMKRAISETTRRREIQEIYNRAHNITPKTIIKEIKDSRLSGKREEGKQQSFDVTSIPKEEAPHLIKDLTAQMQIASDNLEYEKAARLRDEILALEMLAGPRKKKR